MTVLNTGGICDVNTFRLRKRCMSPLDPDPAVLPL